MRLRKKILLILIVALLISLTIFYLFFNNPPKATQQKTSSPTINVSYENFAEVISKNSMIKALPDNSEILLNFYNFNSGQRVVEKSFFVSEGITETSQQDAEVIIFLHSKYMQGLTNKNLCSIFRKANKAGDLEIQSSLSDAGLAWKFRSMFKYKDCF